MEYRLNYFERIKYTFYLPAFGKAICLQKRVWWGWKTVSWRYPDILKKVYGDDTNLMIQALFLSYNYKKKGIGEDIILKMRENG